MLFALDKDNKRLHIEKTFTNQDYFCPLCGEKLVLKKGRIRIHHFAHPNHSECTDSWHYDMSEWHQRWQARFPLETQEIVQSKDGQKHRADVLLEDKKVVFEFQHSPLSAEEFENRNTFYNSLGYKVIWIFDVSDQYENESIENYRSDLFRWSRPRRTFNYFNPKIDGVELYFQIQNSARENEKMLRIQEMLDVEYDPYNENEDYYDCHKDDKNELIKVTWAPESGFERFATDGFVYDENDIVNRFIESNKEKDKTTRLGDLTDYLIEMYSRDHTTYYFGCPRSSTHLCASSNIDTPDSKYNEIMPCMECEYRAYDENYKPICKKRFIDLGLSGNTQVEVLEKNSNGFVSKLSYDDASGRHVLNYLICGKKIIIGLQSLKIQDSKNL
jgi:ssDNA-binding Zn-finger/Zn-ribbon topoisomerase 1